MGVLEKLAETGHLFDPVNGPRFQKLVLRALRRLSDQPQSADDLRVNRDIVGHDEALIYPRLTRSSLGHGNVVVIPGQLLQVVPTNRNRKGLILTVVTLPAGENIALHFDQTFNCNPLAGVPLTAVGSTYESDPLNLWTGQISACQSGVAGVSILAVQEFE